MSPIVMVDDLKSTDFKYHNPYARMWTWLRVLMLTVDAEAVEKRSLSFSPGLA